jgi:hypothetical protein
LTGWTPDRIGTADFTLTNDEPCLHGTRLAFSRMLASVAVPADTIVREPRGMLRWIRGQNPSRSHGAWTRVGRHRCDIMIKNLAPELAAKTVAVIGYFEGSV